MANDPGVQGHDDQLGARLAFLEGGAQLEECSSRPPTTDMAGGPNIDTPMLRSLQGLVAAGAPGGATTAS